MPSERPIVRSFVQQGSGEARVYGTLTIRPSERPGLGRLEVTITGAGLDPEGEYGLVLFDARGSIRVPFHAAVDGTTRFLRDVGEVPMEYAPHVSVSGPGLSRDRDLQDLP